MLQARTILLALPLLALVLGLASGPARAFPTPPTQFVDEVVVAGLDAPTNATFLPDGRLFIVEQYSGKIRLIVNGALAAIDPVGVVTGVRSGGEAGLLGIAVDPGFPARPYVYVQATHTGPNSIRITRYRLTGDLAFAGNGAMALDPVSRYEVIANLPDLAPKHNGGSLRFGLGGMLYAAVGDDDAPCLAQDLTKLQGKILRLDVSGLPTTGAGPPRYATITPPGNPFIAHADSAARLVWALGLRNPFSFTIDPVTGCLFIGDVGNEGWEEIDVACGGGKNFGWPHYEGPQRLSFNCSGADTTAFVAGAYAYEHTAPGFAVASGPVYRPPAGASAPFPAEYTGTQFYADTWRGFVRRIVPSGPNWTAAPPVPGQPTADDWANGIPWITSLHVGPLDGSLYYTMLYRTEPVSGPGEVRRLRYVEPSTGVDEPAGAVDAAPGLAFIGARPSPAVGRTATELAWRQAAAGPVALSIHDTRGRFVRRLAAPGDGARSAGEHRLAWDGRDAAGQAIAAGVYVAKLEAQGMVRALRLVRL